MTENTIIVRCGECQSGPERLSRERWKSRWLTAGAITGFLQLVLNVAEWHDPRFALLAGTAGMAASAVVVRIVWDWAVTP